MFKCHEGEQLLVGEFLSSMNRSVCVKIGYPFTRWTIISEVPGFGYLEEIEKYLKNFEDMDDDERTLKIGCDLLKEIYKKLVFIHPRMDLFKEMFKEYRSARQFVQKEMKNSTVKDRILEKMGKWFFNYLLLPAQTGFTLNEEETTIFEEILETYSEDGTRLYLKNEIEIDLG